MDRARQPDFTNQTIYVGINVHQRSWTVTIHPGDFEYKTFTHHPDPNVLANYLGRTFPGGTYLAAYEAGYSGFWIHDELVGMGSTAW